jgi:hypothetical protein
MGPRAGNLSADFDHYRRYQQLGMNHRDKIITRKYDGYRHAFFYQDDSSAQICSWYSTPWRAVGRRVPRLWHVVQVSPHRFCACPCQLCSFSQSSFVCSRARGDGGHAGAHVLHGPTTIILNGQIEGFKSIFDGPAGSRCT